MKIGNLTTVNGGQIVPFENSFVEVLSPALSGHRDNIVVAYAAEGNIKVSMCYAGKNFVIDRFRGHDNLQHYWSRSISKEAALASKKYERMARYCIRAYESIFKV